MRHEQIHKVLLIDDDPDQLLMVDGLLGRGRDRRFELTATTSYGEGLKLLRFHPFDVCLVDYRLGAYTGIQLIGAARRQGCCAPMILVTGHGTPQIESDAMLVGAMDLLDKSTIECERVGSKLLERSMLFAIERSRSLQTLTEQNERYVHALQGAAEGVWDWDLCAKRITLSPEFKDLAGIDDEEAEYDIVEWFSRIHPEDADALTRDFSDHLQGLTPHVCNEHRFLLNEQDWHWSAAGGNGSCRWVLVQGRADRDDSGHPYRMSGTITDITQLKADHGRRAVEARGRESIRA